MVEQVSDSAVRLESLRKRYGRRGVEALRGVSLRVERGECFGLLGPNGAGKTTLMKLLMTTLHATGGQAWLLDRPIGDRRVLARVGYLPEAVQFPLYLTPVKMLDYIGRLTGVSRADRRRRTPELIELVGMSEWADVPIKRFSKGMTQRVALAQAMINAPELLFLDEPTDGLDPVGRAQVRGLIGRLHADGVTIFLNSHLLNEVEQTCTRVAVLHRGEVLRVADTGALVVADRVRYRVRVSGPIDRAAGLLGRFKPSVADDGLDVDLPGPEAINEVIDTLRGGGVTIVEVVRERASLEAQFLQLLEDAPVDAPGPEGAAP